jgi:hypothetical protein
MPTPCLTQSPQRRAGDYLTPSRSALSRPQRSLRKDKTVSHRVHRKHRGKT